MTAISLHPTPRWRAVVDEQLRAVGLSLRAEGVIFFSVLLIVAALVVVQAIRALHLPPVQYTTVPGGVRATYTGRPDFTYGPSATIPMVLAAVLIPYAVWGQGDRGVTRYLRALPLPRFEHTMVRVLAGWTWLMAAVAAYVLWIVATGAIIDGAYGRAVHASVPAWQWLVPFTSTTIAYVVGSVAVVGSRHPLRWMAAVFFAYLLFVMTAEASEAEGMKQAAYLVASGKYGLQPAVFGMFRHDDPHLWIGATLAWAIPSMLALLLVANRRGEE